MCPSTGPFSLFLTLSFIVLRTGYSAIVHLKANSRIGPKLPKAGLITRWAIHLDNNAKFYYSISLLYAYCSVGAFGCDYEYAVTDGVIFRSMSVFFFIATKFSSLVRLKKYWSHRPYFKGWCPRGAYWSRCDIYKECCNRDKKLPFWHDGWDRLEELYEAIFGKEYKEGQRFWEYPGHEHDRRKNPKS